MIPTGTPPEEILSTLGIAEPDDIDIEAIAWECGATILYEPLTGCEANIIGSGDKAIITVNSKAIPARKRFSSGHGVTPQIYTRYPLPHSKTVTSPSPMPAVAAGMRSGR